ncbi:hypothetical protein [Aeoliella sp. SH292]|uniref:hypothetical protein n=1 Tax=Aeoliella sp. SH292 TaxID=3454464 RepID=UPI003F9CC026
MLAARQKDDVQEITTVEDTSPWIFLPIPDVRWPEMILYAMSAVHAAEQLDHRDPNSHLQTNRQGSLTIW